MGITGGEPTTTGDNFFQIIQACKNHLPKTNLHILSNGIVFEEMELARRLVSIDHSSLSLGIPLYGDSDKLHNTIVKNPNAFYKTIRGLYNFAKLRQHIEIRIVILKQNYSRLAKLAEFLYHNFPFVIHIAFMGIEMRASAKENYEKTWIAPQDFAEELKKAVKYLRRRDLRVSIYNLPLCLLPKELWQFSMKSISDWKNVYPNKCNDCVVKKYCAGFFESTLQSYDSQITPLKN